MTRVPSILHALWPDDALPLAEEVRHRLHGWGDVLSAESHAQGFWSLTVQLHEYPFPARIFCSNPDEQIQFQHERTRWTNKDEEKRALRCRWALGLEFPMLIREDPVGSYHFQLKLAQALCSPVPAVYDTSSHFLRSGSEIDRLTNTRVPPRVRELYSIHAVRQEQQPEAKYWLHTHGLTRAGIPECELIELPESDLESGAQLLEAFVAAVLDQELPPPAVPFQIGHELEVSWRPWHEVADQYPKAFGGRQDRRGLDGSHQGERLIIGPAHPNKHAPRELHGSFISQVVPIEALDALTQRGGIQYLSKRDTERMASLAKERWPIFGMLFARHKDHREHWSFLAKFGYPVDDGSESEREHLWFDVQDIVPGQIKAALLNEPMYVSSLNQGESDWHDLKRLTDWTIISPLGHFNPESADYLWDAARPHEARSQEASAD